MAFGEYTLENVANQRVMITLAGRNVVKLALTAAALYSQNAQFLAYTFLMHPPRELQDMFIVLYCHGIETSKGIAVYCAFLLAFVIPEFLA